MDDKENIEDGQNPQGSSNPGPDQLANMLQRLASMWQGLQNGTLPQEIANMAASRAQQLTSKTEQEHTNTLEAALGQWMPDQRMAFAASLAERWLRAYDEFSAQEGWGDAGRLRRILDAVWDRLLGRKLSASTFSRYSQQITENAPDTEEFDAPRALAACEILDHTLQCCKKGGDVDYAISAALAACSCYAMMAQGRDYRGDDPEVEEQLWQHPGVQAEIAAQKTLLEEIAPITNFDAETVQALRREASSAGL